MIYARNLIGQFLDRLPLFVFLMFLVCTMNVVPCKYLRGRQSPALDINIDGDSSNQSLQLFISDLTQKTPAPIITQEIVFKHLLDVRYGASPILDFKADF